MPTWTYWDWSRGPEGPGFLLLFGSFVTVSLAAVPLGDGVAPEPPDVPGRKRVLELEVLGLLMLLGHREYCSFTNTK